ncbi:ABC transporter substrate-binding protein [Streptomyces sp. NPDC002520]
MKFRLMTTAGATAALALVLAGCGSEAGGSAGGGDKGEYRVLVLGGLSAEGALADNASMSVNAAKAGVDFANELGGVGGRKVTIEVLDDGADPTAAVTKLREAIGKGKPDLVLNSGPSAVAEATLPILNQNRILSFNIGPTATSSDPSKFPLNFDLSPGPADQIAAYLPYFKEKGYGRVGILHGNSSYGEAYGEVAEKAFSDAGVDVTANKEYDIAALDMTAQIEAIKATKPDALVLDAYGAPLGYVLKGLEKTGWDIPVIGDTSVAATDLVATPPPSGVLGTSQVKNLVMQVYVSTKHDEAATAVNKGVARLKKLGAIKSTLILAYNYDALPLVVAAAKSTGSTDPQKIAKALESSTVQDKAKTAVLSHYGFTAKVHRPSNVEKEFAFIPPSAIKDGQFQ